MRTLIYCPTLYKQHGFCETEQIRRACLFETLQDDCNKCQKSWADSLTLCLIVLSADNLCKQFGPRSVPTKRLAGSGSKLFDTDGVLDFFL